MVTFLIIAFAVLLLAGLASGSTSTGGQTVTVLVGPPAGAQAGGAEAVLTLLLIGGLLFVLFLVLSG